MNTKRVIHSIVRLFLALIIMGGLLQKSSEPASAATQFDIHGPAGSVSFGRTVAALPNGNFVVTDPDYDGGIGVQVGAVYLYNGDSGALISTLTGMTAGDRIGSGGITVLSNGNYVVRSPNWDNGTAVDAGAVTWGSGTSGVSGVVSVANSLVGSTSYDRVGEYGVTSLSNGNYTVSSSRWDNGGIADAGDGHLGKWDERCPWDDFSSQQPGGWNIQ